MAQACTPQTHYWARVAAIINALTLSHIPTRAFVLSCASQWSECGKKLTYEHICSLAISVLLMAAQAVVDMQGWWNRAWMVSVAIIGVLVAYLAWQPKPAHAFKEPIINGARSAKVHHY